jgi:hypothetical protein
MQPTQLTCALLAACCLGVTGCVPKVKRDAARAKDQVQAAKSVVTDDESPAKQAKKAKKDAQAAKTTAADKKADAQTWTFEGWGKTQLDAENMALKKAQATINTYLQGLKPPFAWSPSLEYVHKNLFSKKEPVSLGREKVVLDEQGTQEEVYGWTWTISLPPWRLDEMRHEDSVYRAELAVKERSTVAEDRMIKLGRIVGLSVLGLTVTALYLRRTPKSKSRESAKPHIQMVK